MLAVLLPLLLSLGQLNVPLFLTYRGNIKFRPFIAGLTPAYAVSDGNASLLSFEYITSPITTCFKLLVHSALRAASLVLCSTGSRIPIRTPIMATTTNNSIRVKPLRFVIVRFGFTIEKEYRINNVIYTKKQLYSSA
jgi:hypothetical protein